MSQNLARKLAKAPARRERQVVFVAGVRGAGKTTFLWDLAERRLPREIRDLLPPSAHHWPQADAADFEVWLPRLNGEAEESLDRLVLHYDLVSYSFGVHPDGLRAVDLADRLTAITIAPSIDWLTLRYAARTSGFREAMLRDGLLPAAARNHVARPLITRGSGIVDVDKAVSRLDGSRRSVLKLYSQPHWLEGVYHGWETELRDRFHGASLDFAAIEPVPAAPDGPSQWRVKRC